MISSPMGGEATREGIHSVVGGTAEDGHTATVATTERSGARHPVSFRRQGRAQTPKQSAPLHPQTLHYSPRGCSVQCSPCLRLQVSLSPLSCPPSPPFTRTGIVRSEVTPQVSVHDQILPNLHPPQHPRRVNRMPTSLRRPRAHVCPRCQGKGSLPSPKPATTAGEKRLTRDRHGPSSTPSVWRLPMLIKKEPSGPNSRVRV